MEELLTLKGAMALVALLVSGALAAFFSKLLKVLWQNYEAMQRLDLPKLNETCDAVIALETSINGPAGLMPTVVSMRPRVHEAAAAIGQLRKDVDRLDEEVTTLRNHIGYRRGRE